MRCTAPIRWADASDGDGGRHGAGAPDGVAVEPISVRDLGSLAFGLGAFRTEPRVLDDGAMAVLKTVLALVALVGHGPFISLHGAESGEPR